MRVRQGIRTAPARAWTLGATAAAVLPLGNPGAASSLAAQDPAPALVDRATLDLPDEPVEIGRRWTLRSEILDEDREVVIALPPGYDGSTGRYPVLYLLDGQADLPTAVGATVLLEAADRIPAMIIVGVVHPDRGNDLTPSEGFAPWELSIPLSPDTARDPSAADDPRAGEFLRFLHEELAPFIDDRYRTTSFRILFGHSLGGFFTTYAFLTRPEAFNGYIASSPGLLGSWEAFDQVAAERLNDPESLAGRFYVSTVGEDEPWGVWGASRMAWGLELFRTEGLRWWHHVVPGESHVTVAYRSVHDGLRDIFREYAVPPPIVLTGDLPRLEALEGPFPLTEGESR